MKVYILHIDVDYEFGFIQGVFSSEEAAVKYQDNFIKINPESKKWNFTIDQWTVED